MATSVHAAWCPHRPKIVAATATIKGAERDAGLMYGKTLRVFPLPLLTAKDNFFAVERVGDDDHPGRLHLGLLTRGGRARSATEQPAASLLSTAHLLKNNQLASNEDLDPYWTLVMYFNSLRELGGGQTSLHRNIPQWISSYTGGQIRSLDAQRELTSRRTPAELTTYREELNQRLQDGDDVVDVLCSATCSKSVSTFNVLVL